MLAELHSKELSFVVGGLSTKKWGALLTGTGTTLSILTSMFHGAGDGNDPSGTGKNAIFTERTANIITFSLSCLNAILSGIGTALVLMAEDEVKPKTS